LSRSQLTFASLSSDRRLPSEMAFPQRLILTMPPTRNPATVGGTVALSHYRLLALAKQGESKSIFAVRIRLIAGVRIPNRADRRGRGYRA